MTTIFKTEDFNTIISSIVKCRIDLHDIDNKAAREFDDSCRVTISLSKNKAPEKSLYYQQLRGGRVIRLLELSARFNSCLGIHPLGLFLSFRC